MAERGRGSRAPYIQFVMGGAPAATQSRRPLKNAMLRIVRFWISTFRRSKRRFGDIRCAPGWRIQRNLNALVCGQQGHLRTGWRQYSMDNIRLHRQCCPRSPRGRDLRRRPVAPFATPPAGAVMMFELVRLKGSNHTNDKKTSMKKTFDHHHRHFRQPARRHMRARMCIRHGNIPFVAMAFLSLAILILAFSVMRRKVAANSQSHPMPRLKGYISHARFIRLWRSGSITTSRSARLLSRKLARRNEDVMVSAHGPSRM